MRIRYESDGAEIVAVQPDDYIYPSDVRVDEPGAVLYVKADGWASGIERQTWLYTYDLQERKQLSKLLVEPSALPAECPMPK